MKRIDTKHTVPPGRTGVLAAVDLIWFLSACRWTEELIKYLKADSLCCSGVRQMYIFCRGNPSSAVFPQRLKGNLRVLTFPSARANYKAGGEAGGGSTVWRRDISVLLGNSLLESQLGASSSCHPCLQFAFISSSCLPFFLPFLLFHASSLLFCPHPSFTSSSPSFVPLNIDFHFFQLRFSSISSHFPDFWYTASDYTARENRNIKSIKYPLPLFSRFSLDPCKILLIPRDGGSN